MPTAKQLMRAGELYRGDDPELNRELDQRQALVASLNFGDGIRLGARCFVNFNCTMLDGAPVTLGDECLLGPGVQLITATHPLDPVPRRAGWEQALPVTLADGVWLGAGVLVCPGASIGENTAVGAGSVVTGSLPAGVLAYGNPARVIRELNPSVTLGRRGAPTDGSIASSAPTSTSSPTEGEGPR